MINWQIRKGYRISEVLKALKVSKSTYYDWVHWHPSQQAQHHEALRKQVVQTWNDNFRIYGYPRIAAAMIKKGIKISKRFVWQLIRESGIRSRMQKKFTKPTTTTDTDQKPNLAHLNRDGTVLYTDITYIPIVGYLASVFDANTHRIVAYNLNAKMTAQLATKPVVKAHWALPNASMVHSDMGSQYTSQLFESTLDSYGLVHSYSLKSHPYDNALIENFHSMLKREWVFHQRFTSIAHARLSIIKYIKWFNHERISYHEMANMQIN